MTTGRVKWFDNNKGFGFIVPDEDGRDVFVHYSSIKVQGFRTLNESDRVRYDVEEGEKGPQATNVEIIGDDADETS